MDDRVLFSSGMQVTVRGIVLSVSSDGDVRIGFGDYEELELDPDLQDINVLHTEPCNDRVGTLRRHSDGGVYVKTNSVENGWVIVSGSEKGRNCLLSAEMANSTVVGFTPFSVAWDISQKDI